MQIAVAERERTDGFGGGGAGEPGTRDCLLGTVPMEHIKSILFILVMTKNTPKQFNLILVNEFQEIVGNR